MICNYLAVEMLFFIFRVSNFKFLSSKVLWKNHLFYHGFQKFYYVPSSFDLYIFEMKQQTFPNFWRFAHFFLNERNITTSILMIHLKFTVVHYANLSPRSMNKLFLNYRLSHMLYRFFFDFLFMFMKNLSFFW